jgi:hypothetical protein
LKATHQAVAKVSAMVDEVMVKSRALGARSFVVGYGRPTYEPFAGELPERPKGDK